MVDTAKGEKIYEAVKHKLKVHKGKLMAIEVDSGDYFLGKTTIEAINLARKKYPKKKLYIKRVGARATYFIGSTTLDPSKDILTVS